MSLENRYIKLFSKSAKSGCDYAKGTIYVFEKYCLSCGVGMIRPKFSDRRTYKKNYRNGFCGDLCKENGPRCESYVMKANQSDPSPKKDFPLEEMAFLRIEIEKELNRQNPISRLVDQADKGFKYLSEKLRFLELETGDSWTKNRFYFWLNKYA